MCPYPDGTGPNDPRAPWNDPKIEQCKECGGRFTEDGHKPVSELIYVCHCGYEWEVDSPDVEPAQCPECGRKDIRQLPCPNEGETMEDYEQAERAAVAEAKMEDKRLKERL